MSGRGALAAYGAFAGALAMAGLPLYLHAPKFWADEMGLGLGAIGAALLGLRMLDFAQDPILGALIDRLSPRARPWAAMGAAVVLALAVVGVFAPPAGAGLIWMMGTLAFGFAAFSALQILAYAHGASLGARIGQTRAAAGRETGALIGICLAALAPALLMRLTDEAEAFRLYAFGFAGLMIGTALLMLPLWEAAPAAQSVSLGALLRDAELRPFFLFGLLNALPTALTSTLFVFYVEHILKAPEAAGPFLLAFFLSAALAAPLWAKAAGAFGLRRALLMGMGLSILTFLGAYALGPGDLWPFTLICVASGAALGADMTLPAALLSQRLIARGLSGGRAFGLWSLSGNLALALGAALALPLLEAAGFPEGPRALPALSFLYALLPCLLKLAAMAAALRLSENAR